MNEEIFSENGVPNLPTAPKVAVQEDEAPLSDSPSRPLVIPSFPDSIADEISVGEFVVPTLIAP
jgi:hypothetical protein